MPIDRERLFGVRKTSEYENASSKYVFTPISKAFSLLLVRTPITPNQLTISWGLLMIVGSILFFFGKYYLNIIGAVCWVVAYVLDYVDGDIARYKNMKSSRGAFQDLVNHRATYPLMMFGIGFGAWITGRTELFGVEFDPAAYLIMGFLGGLGMLLIMDLGDVYNRTNPTNTLESDEGSAAVEGSGFKNQRLFKMMMNLNPLVFTNMKLLCVVFAILNIMDLFIIFYGLLYPVAAFARYVILYKRCPGVKGV